VGKQYRLSVRAPPYLHAVFGDHVHGPTLSPCLASCIEFRRERVDFMNK
jgi:hypothetical protein